MPARRQDSAACLMPVCFHALFMTASSLLREASKEVRRCSQMNRHKVGCRHSMRMLQQRHAAQAAQWVCWFRQQC